jgi:SAM-dependent methyltransferase
VAQQSPPGLSEVYDKSFHRAISEESFRSASRVWPVVLAATEAPTTAVDIGCGLGTWLAALQALVPNCEVTGVDHPDVVRADLLIPPERFVPADLEKPIDLKRRFDICISVEVAEHLERKCAPEFVRTLVRHSDQILFSAAIPGQGGSLHVNEQWPSYWIKLFSEHGYRCFDFIRPQIWTDRAIESWYRQNILFFSKRDIRLEPNQQNWLGADIAHPEIFMSERAAFPRTLKNLVRFLTKRL